MFLFFFLEAHFDNNISLRGRYANCFGFNTKNYNPLTTKRKRIFSIIFLRFCRFVVLGKSKNEKVKNKN